MKERIFEAVKNTALASVWVTYRDNEAQQFNFIITVVASEVASVMSCVTVSILLSLSL